ncbi:MAG: carboxymuconolactone decarboxylase family protein [Chloroflexota bacterium]|nr:carboxymuconolactone decarboxylase family protein [Lentimicrobium sp.]
MSDKLREFNEYRDKMNKRLLSAENNKILKRIYSVDTLCYEDGALNAKTKEMLGLVSSMVLRCDDCIKYHLITCHELGLSEAELMEVVGIANLVGGTIVIPHTRRAIEFWDELKASE